MARTVDQEAHARRRDEILDVAKRLVETKGYDQMSVQDVLDELGISKGALYHYFGSKRDLLAGLVERTGDTIHTHLAAVAGDSAPTALDKLQRLFDALAGWKTQHRDELVALLRVWQSDGNALMRQKMRATIANRLSPVLDGIIDQGVREGTFAGAPPTGLGRTVVALMQDLNERMTELFFAYEAGSTDLDAVEPALVAYTIAIERVLGLPPKTLSLVEPEALNAWFDPQRTEKESP